MDDDENDPENETKKSKNPLYVLKKEEFVGKTVYESYMHYHHEKSTSNKEEYFRLCRTIEHGKELLQTIEQAEKTDKQKIQELYDNACLALETAITKKPTQTFKWSDPVAKSSEIYTITSEDGGNVSCAGDQYEQALAFFMETQYAFHLRKLRDVDNKIYSYLVKYGIVSSKRPVDDLLDDWMREDLMSARLKEKK